MNRICRNETCNNSARPGRHVCDPCRGRKWRAWARESGAWSDADEYDVELIVRDARPVEGLTRLERVLVARGLTEREVPAEEIARIVGVTPRSVYRWRSEGFRQAA
ncbi:hypothetical protein ACN2WE_05375 [Streptomyces sp. cg28]|uniref:hypothetical protein n=1 Tax=Streptomyces sp. cg28 TaxID=3403457 RepID=UPI003B20DFE8